MNDAFGIADFGTRCSTSHCYRVVKKRRALPLLPFLILLCVLCSLNNCRVGATEDTLLRDAYRRVIRLPSDAGEWWSLGDKLLGRSRAEDAAAAYRVSVRLNPSRYCDVQLC